MRDVPFSGYCPIKSNKKYMTDAAVIAYGPINGQSDVIVALLCIVVGGQW